MHCSVSGKEEGRETEGSKWRGVPVPAEAASRVTDVEVVPVQERVHSGPPPEFPGVPVRGDGACVLVCQVGEDGAALKQHPLRLHQERHLDPKPEKNPMKALVHKVKNVLRACLLGR